MPLLLTAALVASAASLPTCSWDRPGASAYVGTMAAAVDRYSDIPLPVREALKKRMARHEYDEIAAIRRDSITGKSRYAPDLRQMHFGAGQVCGTVTRGRWSEAAVERGLVYCESGQCLIVPTVCRNVSRVIRLGPAEPAAASKEAAPAAAGAAPAAAALVAAVPESAATQLSLEAMATSQSFAETSGLGSDSSGGAFASGAGLSALLAYAGPAGSVGGVAGTSIADAGVPPTSSTPLNGGARDVPDPSVPLPLDPVLPDLGGGGFGGLPGLPVSTVPEPGAAMLILLGLPALAVVVRRRRQRDLRETRAI